MPLQPLKRTQPHPFLPDHPSLRRHNPLLLRERHTPDGLPRRRPFIPHHARVFGGMMQRVRAELDAEIVDRVVGAEIVDQPIGEDGGRRGGGDGAVRDVRALHGGRGGEETHVAVVVAEAEGGLREHVHGDDVGVGEHGGSGLLEGIGAGGGGGEECRGGGVEVLLSERHDVQGGVDVGQLEHGRVVEEEILRFVAVAIHPGLRCGRVEDLQTHTSGSGGGVGLEEDGLVGIAGDDRVSARVGEETLLQVWRQV